MGDDENVITYGSTLVCDQTLRPITKISTDVRGSAITACLLNRFSVTIHSLLFPRSIVDATGPWEGSLTVSEDWDFVLRALDHAEVRGDSDVATYYRTHESMSSHDLAAGIDGYRRVVERYFERHPEERGSKLHRQAEAEWHLFTAEQMFTRWSRYSEPINHLGLAFPLEPWRAVRLGVRLSGRLILTQLSKIAERARQSSSTVMGTAEPASRPWKGRDACGARGETSDSTERSSPVRIQRSNAGAATNLRAGRKPDRRSALPAINLDDRARRIRLGHYAEEQAAFEWDQADHARRRWSVRSRPRGTLRHRVRCRDAPPYVGVRRQGKNSARPVGPETESSDRWQIYAWRCAARLTMGSCGRLL